MISVTAIVRGSALLLLLLCGAAQSHNGEVALAAPVRGIAVDGDLSDWPTSVSWHPIAITAYGHRPRSAEDFTGRFAIGYNGGENALYLAVAVRDESMLIDTTARANWDTQDGCDLFLDLAHGDGNAPAAQLLIYGDSPLGRHMDVAVRRRRDGHSYEWRVDVGALGDGAVTLAPGRVLGVDVAVCDRDGDGSFSWVAWGRGTLKRTHADRRETCCWWKPTPRWGKLAAGCATRTRRPYPGPECNWHRRPGKSLRRPMRRASIPSTSRRGPIPCAGMGRAGGRMSIRWK